ncbi:MAG TPA: response regulator [Pseudomonadales bacterium]|nr:response regulator [Pseudomonadales bacterium]
MNETLDILLVEDDAVFASVLTRSLERRGHTVTLATDLAQARSHLSGQGFTHAILDLKLAQESSLPLIPELLAVLPALPILILTG